MTKFHHFITIKQRDRIEERKRTLEYRNKKKEEARKLKAIRSSYNSKKRRVINATLKKLDPRI